MVKYRDARRTSPRMFQRDALEFFTHVHPSVPWILGVPAMVGAAYLAALSLTPSVIVGTALAGLFGWTLMEYLLHRFVFHYHPRSAWGKKVHFSIHGVHHEYPDDATRLVMPPVLSVPLGAMVFGTMWLLGGAYGAAAFIGLVTGYIAYDTIHYVVHHFPLKSRVGKALKAHHLRHHNKEDDRGFGVSNPLWDLVFRTTFRKKARSGRSS